MRTLGCCLVFIAAVLVNKVSAQGNLQFNQVIVYNILPNSATAFTVPAGKVWKVESAGIGGTAGAFVALRDVTSSNLAMLLGGNNIVFPFWLPASFSGSFVNLPNPNSYRAFVSIIEFNVIP